MAKTLSREETKEYYELKKELHDLRKQHGLEEEEEDLTLFAKLGTKYYDFKDRHTTLNPVKRSTYLWLCLLSIFGVQHFYAKHYVKGIIYAALSWTGISIAFGFIDWMIAVPKEPDENGMILI